LLEHVDWNVRLLPAGFELELFGAVSGRDDPDFIAIRSESRLAAFLDGVAVSVLLVGGVHLWRRRRWWWKTWLRERFDACALAACLVLQCGFVALT
jgi:hypothetical protein